MGQAVWITSVAGAFLAIGAAVATPAAHAGQAVVVQEQHRVVNQQPQYRVQPVQRHHQPQRVWVPAHWEQRGHQRVWVQGHYVTKAPQYAQADRRDIDRDGIRNRHDRDIDGDGVANDRDRDRDGDGVLNRHDRAPDNAHRR